MTIVRLIARLVGLSLVLVAIGQFTLGSVMGAILFVLVALFCVEVVR